MKMDIKMDKKFLDSIKKMLRIMLAENPDGVIVRFKKKDGTMRTMHCTTRPDYGDDAYAYVPEENMPKGQRENTDDDLFKVYDIDEEGWRSFRFESLEEIQTPFDN